MIEPQKAPSYDLDPLFLKAIKLFNSKNKNAADELKQLLDDVISQKKYDGLSRKNENDGASIGKKITHHSAKEVSELKKKETDVDKDKALDKLRQELQDLANNTPVIPCKKPRLDISYSSNSSRSSESGNSKESEDNKDYKEANDGKNSDKNKSIKKNNGSSKDVFYLESTSDSNSPPMKESKKAFIISSNESVSDMDAGKEEIDKTSAEYDDIQFEMEINSISCVICKSLNVFPNNMLVECQECHSLYHQDCHKPHIVDNVNDPRYVWYCIKCTKNLKKILTKTTTKKPKPIIGVSNSNELAIIKPVKVESLAQPFKRLETTNKTSINNSGVLSFKESLLGLSSLSSHSVNTSSLTRTGTGGGLANLAANLGAQNKSTSDLNRLRNKLTDDSKNQYYDKSKNLQKISSKNLIHNPGNHIQSKMGSSMQTVKLGSTTDLSQQHSTGATVKSFTSHLASYANSQNGNFKSSIHGSSISSSSNKVLSFSSSLSKLNEAIKKPSIHTKNAEKH